MEILIVLIPILIVIIVYLLAFDKTGSSSDSEF